MPVLARHVVHATEVKERELTALQGKSIELLPHLQELALTIAAQSMFSLEAKKLRHRPARAAPPLCQELRQGRLSRPRSAGRIPTPTDLARALFRRDWLRLVDRVIDAREAIPRTEAEPRDLFDLLASAQDPETSARFSRAELRDEVATMILARARNDGGDVVLGPAGSRHASPSRLTASLPRPRRSTFQRTKLPLA